MLELTNGFRDATVLFCKSMPNIGNLLSDIREPARLSDSLLGQGLQSFFNLEDSLV